MFSLLLSGFISGKLYSLPPLKHLCLTTVSYLATCQSLKVDAHTSHESLNRYQQTRKSRLYQPFHHRIMSLRAFESVNHSAMPAFFAIPRAVAHQFMEFSRQEYWSGLLCPSPGDLPDPRIEILSPVSPALTGWFFTS